MIFESFFLNVLVLIILLVALTFDYVTKFFSYWYVRHINSKTSIPLFGSDYHRVFGIRNNTDEVNALLNRYHKDKLVGTIRSRIPELIVKDVDAAKIIMSKNFEHFSSRGLALDKSRDVCLRNNLFYTDGAKWSLLRETLESLMNELKLSFQDNNDCLDGINGDKNVQELLSDILDVTFVGFLINNEPSTKEKSLIKDLRVALQARTWLDRIKYYIKSVFPSVYTLLGLSTLPEKLTNFNQDTLQNSRLKKFIGELPTIPALNVRQKYSKNVDEPTPGDFTFSVLSMFLTEGYIPCHNVLTALLFEIAKDVEFQEKMRQSETYLDSAVKETLRLHSPFSVVTRKCTKMFRFPEGCSMSHVVFDKNITVALAMEHIHKDSDYFKEPESFKPDRFISNEESVSDVYLPYGAGPRKCIGEELSLDIIKSVTKAIIERYQIETTTKTASKLQKTDHNFSRYITNDIWLKFKPISEKNTVTY